ncbi:MAG: hypothetical protein Q4A01_07950, partial [Coriobacteriales bacterium]|nr:hypothetical protein [Coriobacteriales bacterium]
MLRFIRSKKNEDLQSQESNESRLVRHITTALAMGVGVMLVCCQLCFFPISLGDGLSFHTFLYVLPFAAVALYLSLPAYLGYAFVLGLILSVRVQLVPLDFFEFHFSIPVGSAISSCVFALIVWLAVRGVRKIAGKQGWAERPIAQRIAL